MLGAPPLTRVRPEASGPTGKFMHTAHVASAARSARSSWAWRFEELVHKRKLIEVALPLEAINRESAREKSIRHGHPSTLHMWWARRPLASARAVLFSQLVDDPSSHPDKFPTEAAQR